MNAPLVSRREFLKTGGVLVVGFSLIPTLATNAADTATAATKPVSLDRVESFLAIGADGSVTCYSGKVDLGTGVQTAFAQIVAEEMTVPFSTVRMVTGDTMLTPDQGTTWGSFSVQKGGIQVRQAAATARAALKAEAARQWGVDAAGLTTADGVVRTSAGRKISYAELVRNKQLALPIDEKAPALDPKQYKIVGRSIKRVDIPAKVTGEFLYMQDFRVPGMVHARVVRPPAIEARLLSVDEKSAADIPGMIGVVRDGNFLAVVAESEWSAIKAARTLKATWSEWAGLPDETKLWEHVRATKVVKEDVTSNIAQGHGDAKSALSGAAKRLSATYDFAIHTHGSIGPSCSVADFRDGALTCWSSSQGTHALRRQLAAMLKLPEDKVRAIYIDGAGCYGRNGHEDAAGDAALIAQKLGRPVRVQWMRADEHGWDPKGPPTLIDLEGGLDAKGNVVAWHGEFYHPQGGSTPVALVAAELADLPRERMIAPTSVTQNSAIPYSFPHVFTVCHRLETTPFRPSWIRSPGRLQNTFANEAFLDELAVAAANADPFDFRLRYHKDPRGTELLQRLRTLSKWKGRSGPKSNGDKVAGRGVAYTKYELSRTYVGAVATVEVERKTGVIHVKNFAVVHDCGQIINPDGVRNQIEGNIVQTTSRTLKEQLRFDRSHVTSLDWASYPILTFPEIPDVQIELIDRPHEPPWGVGEPTTAIVSAAIANAVWDAIGVRLRSVPFTPEKVLAALDGA